MITSVLDSVDKDIRVLIADDYELTRDMIRSILKQLGFKSVTAVEDGKKVIERLEAERIDLIICDWNMPGMLGIEVLRRVRANPKWSQIPFLMLTAEAYRENVVAALKAGVSDYISKPFTPQTLSEKIAHVLSPIAKK